MGYSLGDSEEFWLDPPESFRDALKTAPDVVDFLTRLIRASLHLELIINKDSSGNVNFIFQQSIGATKIDISLTPNKELIGSDVKMVEHIYNVVRAIEVDLNSLSDLPRELRRLRIDTACKRLDISQDDFNSVLRNWSKF